MHKCGDEEINCECEGKDIGIKLSEYQQHIHNCMRGFRPSGYSAEENNRLMTEKFKSCAQMWIHSGKYKERIAMKSK